MSNIKNLASQTMWYGVSSIAARFINYLLTPYLTYLALVSTADYGRMGTVYAAIPIINIIFTYGMETAYFRFVQTKETAEKVNSTATISILISTVLFTLLLWLNQSLLIQATMLQSFPLLIQLSIVIIALDTLSVIPFARLRNEGRPKRFALIRITGIIINLGAVVFFLSYCPARVAEDPKHWAALIYKPELNPIVYVLIANIIQSAITLLLLSKWVLPEKWVFDVFTWKKMIVFSLPMLVAGLGGMINETFDRLMLGWWLPGDAEYIDSQRGIYNACYKLAILITLFIQAFRMGAEPFFFKEAAKGNPQPVYARVMKFFVITITLTFLGVALFIPAWRYFIDDRYWDGLVVVPVLLLANMCLGVYYNLSVWYKVTSRTMAGAWITLFGTAITFGVNYLFIPRYGYIACAWATLLCYFAMMVISFLWGQKVYYVPYAWKKLLAYFIIVLLLFGLHFTLTYFWSNIIFSHVLGFIFLISYLYFISRVEKKELARIPVINKFVN